MSGEVQPRKRKDKKKKKLEDSARLDDAFQERSVNDKGDEDLSYRDDSEDRGHADDHSHHGSSASALAKFVFFLLFAALLIAMGSIFFQLKGSEIADTPIKESRYGSIFQNFIEEHAADDHDDDHGAEDHGVPAKDDHDDSRESQAAEKEDISDKQHEPPPEVVEPILLEPSMPEHIEIPEPETSDESEDEELEEQYDEIQDEGVDEGEEEPVFEEIARSEEDQSSRTEETEREEVEQSQQDSDIGTEHVPHVEEVLKEEHPNEEIPHLVEQDSVPKSHYDEYQETFDHREVDNELDAVDEIEDISKEDESEPGGTDAGSESDETEESEESQSTIGGMFDNLFEGVFKRFDGSHAKEEKENKESQEEQQQNDIKESAESREDSSPVEHDDSREDTSPFEHDESREDTSPFEHDESREDTSPFEHDESREDTSPFEHDESREDTSPLEHDESREDTSSLEHDETPTFEEIIQPHVDDVPDESHEYVTQNDDIDSGNDDNGPDDDDDSSEDHEDDDDDEEDSNEDDEIDEETHKEYIKIIDDVLREHHQQQKLESGGKSAYPAASITNDYDYEIRHEIDEANKVLTKAPDKAYSKFSSILEMHPKSPRALYGKAMAMDRLSEIHKNNAILEQSIYSYRDVLDLPDVPDELFKMSAFRCVDRMRFRGFQLKALKVLDRMLLRFPNNAEILNQKAVTYLLMGKNKNAKETLEEILKLHPNNGFAKVHYGFILKIEENDNKMAIKYLQEGIATQEPGTNDGRFYFHLGDALVRENRSKEAYDVYDAGVQKGLFLSKYQRSLYNVKSLKAIPWWSHEQTTYQHYLRILEENWLVIRAEAIPLISDENQGYFPENEGLRNKGQWKQFEMFARGSKITQNCNRTPKTCKLIESIPAAADCKRGQVKFSLMYPGTRVWPHTGPTNCRLRAHLGLVIPEGAGIRVANETRKWKEGRIMVFDDSFEHEVWHEGTSYRLILIVDFWHPDLTEAQKQSLTSI